MNFDKKLAATLTGTVCFLTAMMAPVSAAMFNFSYSGTSVLDPTDIVTASGTLTTSDYDSATNGYEILDITGIRNDVTIESLLSPGSFLDNDNLLLADSPALSEFGFAYTAGGVSYNVFNTYDYLEIGTPGFYTGYPLSYFSITPIPESSLMLGILSLTVLVAINKRNGRFALKKLNHHNGSVAD
ncbi:PEP-CTERM sorting domain-containing protein [Nostoc sp. UHCC 0252]|uniref:PEP-CTERM sorting domain-containing protein n=1 Tax=Nostoc sp. UHCC 0252 TaxID=3110241 RepID=UPI002B1FBA52|nr:PEP-CTERM sorting domain-containing protein [Nostoc sp. UHCC 0252]MEA5602799.1 PEP-CTERM sorting domain-containing protein [Nostoc sp. UHCC 0252]